MRVEATNIAEDLKNSIRGHEATRVKLLAELRMLEGQANVR